MLRPDFQLMLAQPIFLCTLVLYAIGWFITFIGACILGNVPLLWVVVFYNLFLLLGVTLAVSTDAVHTYRLAIVAYIAGSLSLTFYIINATIGSIFSSSNAAASGLIFQSLPLIFWILYFGSEEDSLVKRSIGSFTVPRTPGAMTSNGVAHGVSSPEQQYQQQELSSVVVAPAADYAYKARALYSYEANPEDSNELGFVKGEILDIVDNKGKWWQARKQDGTVGIAPSNYLQLI
ncbi:Transmembrane osmosensor [Mortierella antarctica]|nr:Transmembrane osmosensor [Mortierella antarctica]